MNCNYCECLECIHNEECGECSNCNSEYQHGNCCQDCEETECG